MKQRFNGPLIPPWRGGQQVSGARGSGDLQSVKVPTLDECNQFAAGLCAAVSGPPAIPKGAQLANEQRGGAVLLRHGIEKQQVNREVERDPALDPPIVK